MSHFSQIFGLIFQVTPYVQPNCIVHNHTDTFTAHILIFFNYIDELLRNTVRHACKTITQIKKKKCMLDKKTKFQRTNDNVQRTIIIYKCNYPILAC